LLREARQRPGEREWRGPFPRARGVHARKELFPERVEVVGTSARDNKNEEGDREARSALTGFLQRRSLPDERASVPAKHKSRIHSYTVVFEPVVEGGYNVVVPAIPEICTFGGTFIEAKRMAADAIRCHLEGLEKDGLRFVSDA
jgi:predicted RNase H-like HicB family nuclease